MRIIILIPTYNERDNIVVLLKSIFNSVDLGYKNSYEIFVIDDSSPDGTSEVVRQYSSAINIPNFEINLMHKEKKEGLGKAYIYALNKVLERDNNFDYILQMDADLSHDPIYIRDFIRRGECGDDLVVGSRYIRGGQIKNWTWYRKWVSKFGNILAKTVLSNAISDYTGGYNMYSRRLIKELDLSKLDISGYGFLISLKYQALRNTKAISQIPIVFLDRQNGVSKMPVSTIFKNLILLLKLKIS